MIQYVCLNSNYSTFVYRRLSHVYIYIDSVHVQPQLHSTHSLFPFPHSISPSLTPSTSQLVSSNSHKVFNHRTIHWQRRKWTSSRGVTLQVQITQSPTYRPACLRNTVSSSNDSHHHQFTLLLTYSVTCLSRPCKQRPLLNISQHVRDFCYKPKP